MAEQDNKPNQVNQFIKGMIQDLDINKVPPDKYLTAWDIKLVDKEGQGFILTGNDGNELAFTLSQFMQKNFIPLGWAQHKDILYILSCSTDELGTGEIGCFPSPIDGGGTFEATYKPLKNYWIDSARSEMRSDYFKFSPRHMLDVQIKDHYDGSVDIYFCDGVNPLRVVNSGFTQDGIYNDITYSDDTFETKANLVLSAKTILNVSSFSITTGGIFKFGNYIFFFKYATEDFNETYFVAEYGPIPIYKGANVCSSVQGGKASDRSDKKVTFNLTGIDSTYKYLKIGYLRWFSDYNGVTTSEFGEINTKINITGSSMTVTITGSEGEVFLAETEVMLTKDVDIIPKSIAQLNNRLWGANWKRTKTHDDSLANFAKLIKISYDDTKTIPDYNPWDAAVIYGQYKDYTNYDYVGYFRGEPYVFGIVAELLDGTMTQAYPMNGVDMFSNITPDYVEDSADKGNYEGIFRFPNAHLSSPFDSGIKLLAVKFNAEAAFNSIMAANVNNWIRFNVRAIYFVRGDRYPTLKAQGLMMNACFPGIETVNYPLTQYCSINYHTLNTEQQSNEFALNYNQRWMNSRDLSLSWGYYAVSGTANFTHPYTDKYAPIFRGYMPVSWKSNDTSAGVTRNYTSRVFLVPDKYCFYSVDMLFKQTNDVDDFNYIWRVGKTIDPRPGATTDNPGIWSAVYHGSSSGGVHPFVTSSAGAYNYVNQVPRTASIEAKVMVGEHGFIKPGSSGNLDFINAIDEPFESIDNTWFWSSADLNDPMADVESIYTRSSIFAKYLGITLDHVDNTGSALVDEDFNLDIVNIYTGDPTAIDIRNLFSNILSVQYKKISQGIKITDVVTAIVADSWTQFKNITCWRGDCFLQRTYFKQRYWKGSALLYNVQNNQWNDPEYEGNGAGSTFNSHGLILGFVTENAVNSAMRSAEELSSFFPDTEFYPWVIEPYETDTVESFRMNGGYEKTLSTNIFLMKDPSLPEKILQYTARIKYSDATIPGSYIDAYRSFRINNYKDFDTNNGEIIKLAVVFDKLVSVQENSINEHYINEKLTAPVNDASAAVLGKGDVLSSDFRKMANFGSQHSQSIVQADALYGIDWKKNIIWECSLQRSGAGSLFLDAKDISKEQMIEMWMRGLSLTINGGLTDKINNYQDLVMKGEGINSGFDINTGDIYFTFHKRVESI